MNFIGHCRLCQYTLFAEEDQITSGTDWRKLYPGEARRVHINNASLGVYAHCDEFGHKAFRLYEIKGKYNPDHQCDDRCKFAKGNECTCSCGGANHGRGHAAVMQAKLPETNPQLVSAAMTTKQEEFIKKLLEERILAEDGSDDERRAASYAKLPNLTKIEASAWIEKLLTKPKREG